MLCTAAEAEVQILNFNSKVAFYYGSENRATNKRDAQKVAAALMRFRGASLRLTRLDRHRNPHIRNRLQVNDLIQEVKLCQKCI
jgi:hypothetical protein